MESMGNDQALCTYPVSLQSTDHGVHRLVSSIGCYLADAIVVMLAVRNVDVARRLLRTHCTPNSHPLLQAALLQTVQGV